LIPPRNSDQSSKAPRRSLNKISMMMKLMINSVTRTSSMITLNNSSKLLTDSRSNAITSSMTARPERRDLLTLLSGIRLERKNS